ncbi:MAG: hypothetical protein L3J47_02195 [Sulfurovum sp.]|nr:hypothetical protein [Sulfurovum sp.]
MNELEVFKQLLSLESSQSEKSEKKDDTDLYKQLLLKKIFENDNEEDTYYDENDLIERANLYLNKNIFKVGDKVKWKPKLKNRKYPKYDQIAIIIEVLDKPVYDEEKTNSGSPYFKEPLDIRLAILDNQGDFEIYYYDSNRFQKLHDQ